MKHKDIEFKTRRTQVTENMGKDNREIGKELDTTNPEDLPDYIWLFTHMFNKKKFKKLPEWQEWDHEINLTEEALKELNAKAYAITLKEEEALNQWLNEQTKSRTYSQVKVKICSSMFLYSKERQVTIVGSRLQKTQSSHNQG